MKLLILFFLLTLFPLTSNGQTSDSSGLSEIIRLADQQRWTDIVRIAQQSTERSPDLIFYYGLALARLEHWDEADEAFYEGHRLRPRDKRFLVELAGVSYKQKDYPKAARHLHKVLLLDPSDQYANDFLASIYYLEGNLEAALLFWNRVSKPVLAEVETDPTPKVDPVLLDRAFAFAPTEMLELRELLETEKRLIQLGIFNRYKFNLDARADGRFDLVLRTTERRGLENKKWRVLLTQLRGLPFQTVHAEFFNIEQKGINSVSLLRWDKEKQRVWSSLSGPLKRRPEWRYEFGLDFRDENWELRESTSDEAGILTSLKLRKFAINGSVSNVSSERLEWSTGFEVSHRDLRDVVSATARPDEFGGDGLQLKVASGVSYEFARIPEKRIVASVSVSAELARLWSDPSQVFAGFEGSVRTKWFPQFKGDDYEINLRVRAGKTFGRPPFDELFMLGIERDNELWLRGHAGTRNGRKGNAPLGRDYFLMNLELDKNVFQNEWIGMKVGPFLDTGRVFGDSAGPGFRKWLFDPGLQAKVRLMGVSFSFCYGKDIRTGSETFYVSMPR